MTNGQIREVIQRVLTNIAPEAELDAVDPGADLREQLDIDSVDFLNFVVGVHEELGVDIPEVDYPKLSTLDNCVAYLAGKVGAQ